MTSEAWRELFKIFILLLELDTSEFDKLKKLLFEPVNYLTKDSVNLTCYPFEVTNGFSTTDVGAPKVMVIFFCCNFFTVLYLSNSWMILIALFYPCCFSLSLLSFLCINSLVFIVLIAALMILVVALF